MAGERRPWSMSASTRARIATSSAAVDGLAWPEVPRPRRRRAGPLIFTLNWSVCLSAKAILAGTGACHNARSRCHNARTADNYPQRLLADVRHPRREHVEAFIIESPGALEAGHGEQPLT